MVVRLPVGGWCCRVGASGWLSGAHVSISPGADAEVEEAGGEDEEQRSGGGGGSGDRVAADEIASESMFAFWGRTAPPRNVSSQKG